MAEVRITFGWQEKWFNTFSSCAFQAIAANRRLSGEPAWTGVGSDVTSVRLLSVSECLVKWIRAVNWYAISYRPVGAAIHCLKNGQVASFPMIFPTQELKTSAKLVSIDPSAEFSYSRLESFHSRCANDCICACKLCLIECFRLVTFTWRQRRQKHEHFMHICSIDGAESVKSVHCQVCSRQKREKKIDGRITRIGAWKINKQTVQDAFIAFPVPFSQRRRLQQLRCTGGVGGILMRNRKA